MRTLAGDDDYMGKDSLLILLEYLTKLQGTQVSVHLLRACFVICKVNKLLLTVLAMATTLGPRYLMKMIEKTLRELIGDVLKKAVLNEEKLCIKPLRKKEHAFGIGFVLL